jgi:MFS family permease
MRINTADDKSFYALCVTNFLLRVEWGISTSMLPLYVYEQGGSPLDVGLIFTIFAGINFFATLFWGIMSDYFTKRKVFIVAGMAFIVPIFLIMSMQTEVLLLILLRGSTALFKGAVVPSSWALASDISPPRKVGRNMGVLGATEMAGFALGPALGGLISDGFGFPSLWIFVAIVCLIGSGVFLFFGSDPPIMKSNTRRSLVEALKKSESFSKIDMLCISFLISLLGWSLLGPNLNVYLFKDLGLSRTMVGIVSLIGIGVATLTQPIIGAYSDKYGRKQFLILGALNLILGNIVLFFAKDLSLILLSQILISNHNIFQFIGSAYISDVVPQKEKSTMLGIFGSVGSLARSLGAIVGGYAITLTSIRTVIVSSIIFPLASIIIILSLVAETHILVRKKD